MSGSDVVRGLARIAGVPWSALAPAALDGIPESRDALLDLGDSGAPGLEAWLPAFRQVLRARRFDVLELTFASGERFSVRHVHRLRFWRRA